jgi:signal transduction histidine kinase
MRSLAIVAGYVAAYVFLDWVSYLDPVGAFAITPWNPPPGLSIALLLAFGLRYSPALLVAGVAADLAVRGVPPSLVTAAAADAGVALCYTACAAILLRMGVAPSLGSLRDISRFVLLALVMPALAALAYLGSYAAAGAIAWSAMPRSALQFWVGDAIGILVTTPVLLHLWQRARRPADRLDVREIGLQAAAILAALALVFGLGREDAPKYFYLLFVPLIWIGVRHGVRGASFALLLIQLGIIVAVQIAGFAAATVLEFQLLMFALAITGLVLGAVVTDRQRAQDALAAREAELAHSLRLAAAAETASSLAHELNQPLSAISNYVQACTLLLAQPEVDRERLAGTLRTVAREVSRAGEVIRRLRDFFRSGTSRLERVAVDELVEACSRSLAPRLSREGIALRSEIEPHLAEPLVDRLQIETVLNNLLVNAIDALSSSGLAERAIMIRAGRTADAVKITVVDNGPGVSAELAEDMFRPFVTTKPEGMGLGLAISRSIVENHGGRLVAERAARGAAFSFTLPLGTAQEASL